MPGSSKNKHFRRMCFPAVVSAIEDGQIALSFRDNLKPKIFLYNPHICKERFRVGDRVFYVLYERRKPREDYWGRIVPRLE